MDVEQVLTKHQVLYKHQGADFLVKCLSPDHDDSNPSMRIDKIQGHFHCFSCGFKGNLFKFFNEELPNPLTTQKQKFKQLLSKKMAESVGMQLPPKAFPYKGNHRGISQETYHKFEAFECIDTEYQNRIIFPLKDFSGKTSAFIGRSFGMETPKYKIWPRKARLPLYPFFGAIQGSVILVEGIYDAINLYDKGLTNAVACFGTDNVQDHKISLLKMSGVQLLYTFFDGDEPGQTAVEKVHKICESVEMPFKNIHLKDLDPGELSLNQVIKLRNRLYE